MSPRTRTHRRLALTAVAVTIALVTAACGGSDDGAPDAGSGSGSSRTVDVTMVDIGFEPAELSVKEGETVTFRFANEGKVVHEAYIGDEDDQAEHEKDMSSGEMHHGGGEGAIEVKPGKTGTMTYTFDEAGTTQIGCHEPGHYAAGMKIDVTVE